METHSTFSEVHFDKVASLEPRGCPFSKGSDGLCNYHRAFIEELAKAELTLRYAALAGMIVETRSKHPKQPRRKLGNSSQQPNKF